MTCSPRFLICIVLAGCITGGDAPTPTPNPQPQPSGPTDGSDGGSGGTTLGSNDPGSNGDAGSDGGVDGGNGGTGDSECDVSVNDQEVLCTTHGDSATADCQCLVNGTVTTTCTAPADSACNFGVPGMSNCCGF